MQRTRKARGTQPERHLHALRLLLLGATYTKSVLVVCYTHHCYDLPMIGGIGGGNDGGDDGGGAATTVAVAVAGGGGGV